MVPVVASERGSFFRDRPGEPLARFSSRPDVQASWPTARVVVPDIRGTARLLASTAQVPALRGADAIVGCPTPRRIPLSLRGAVWISAVLVIVGLAGFAVEYSHARSTSHSAPVRDPGRIGVRVIPSSGNAETVMVSAASYSVVVADIQPAWVEVRSPTSQSAVFEGVLEPGDTQSFRSAVGKLSVIFGGAQAAVTLVVNGKPLPRWRFKPTKVPFTLIFSSQSTSSK